MTDLERRLHKVVKKVIKRYEDEKIFCTAGGGTANIIAGEIAREAGISFGEAKKALPAVLGLEKIKKL